MAYLVDQCRELAVVLDAAHAKRCMTYNDTFISTLIRYVEGNIRGRCTMYNSSSVGLCLTPIKCSGHDIYILLKNKDRYREKEIEDILHGCRYPSQSDILDNGHMIYMNGPYNCQWREYKKVMECMDRNIYLPSTPISSYLREKAVASSNNKVFVHYMTMALISRIDMRFPLDKRGCVYRESFSDIDIIHSQI